MDLGAESNKRLLARLRRIEGQVRGLQEMIGDGRECRDVVYQIAAARNALGQLGVRYLTLNLKECLSDPEQASAMGYSEEALVELFAKIA